MIIGHFLAKLGLSLQINGCGAILNEDKAFCDEGYNLGMTGMEYNSTVHYIRGFCLAADLILFMHNRNCINTTI